MKVIILLGLMAVLSLAMVDAATECDKRPIRCHQTEHKAYIECIKHKRAKRAACVEPQVVEAIPIQACVGGTCGDSYAVQPTYSAMTFGQPCGTTPCQVQPAVAINSCLGTCTANCNGAACPLRCQNSCSSPQIAANNERIYANNHTTTIIKTSGEPSYSSPNVTTLIKLTNIVNNTNIVNVPTNINNTNINNLDLGTNATSSVYGMPNGQKKCCVVIQPKVCHKMENSTQYRCTRRHHRTCGEQCASQIVHAQVRQPCQGPAPSCPPSVVYVPQPQPRCSYQPSWPYVSCGQQRPSCGGCYDHYGYGFHNYYGGDRPSCGGCYDDGYQSGPLYRQGPMYRPGYYHMPPVTQPMMPPMGGCGYGCFGNQFMDPAFGMPSYSPYGNGYAPQQMYQPQPQFMPQPQYQPYYPPPQPQYSPYQQYPGSYYPVAGQETIMFNDTGNGTMVQMDETVDPNAIISETQYLGEPYSQPQLGAFPYPGYQPQYNPYQGYSPYAWQPHHVIYNDTITTNSTSAIR